MASPGSEKATTAGSREALHAAYDALRAIDGLHQDLDREIWALALHRIIPSAPQSQSSGRVPGNELKFTGDFGTLKPGWSKFDGPGWGFKLVDDIEQEQEKMIASKAELDGIRSALRCCIDELSRPYMGKLNILDLPDEILLMIFERVENLDLTTPFLELLSPGKEDIQNVRLVCRRFCNVGSQLLLRFVRVVPDESSLARLEEISRHPTISKGVRVIQVVLHFYSETLADFNWFISYPADLLGQGADLLQLTIFSKIPEQHISEAFASGSAVLETLRRLASTDRQHDEYFEEDESHRVRLAETHSEYLNRVEKQQSLLHSGRFPRVLGSAIARMPGARRLDVRDMELSLTKHFTLMMDGDLNIKSAIWDAVHRVLLQPMTAFHVKKYDLDLPDYQLIPNTIDAIRGANTWLNSIRIKLLMAGRSGSLVPSTDIRSGFSSGMQCLEEFDFEYDNYLDELDADDLDEFLSACLDTSSLQKLCLRVFCGDDEETEPTRIDVGRILGSRARDKLRHVNLSHVGVDYSGMVRLLDRLPQSMDFLWLNEVRLLSGTWKDALDTLRGKQYASFSLNEPEGAECDDMSSEDYKRVFGKKDWYTRSPAERYTMNSIPNQSNPLDPPEDEPSTAD